jgi:DNA-3-methyladenine glycosylase I
MGPAGDGRHPAVREDLPRRYPVRPVLADDPDAGIIRHRGKIVSTINNAARAIELRDEFGSLAKFFWSFEPAPHLRPAVMDLATLRANPTTPVSVQLSKALKKRGWTFVGPTTVYAFMQAMGMVNDHLDGCFCQREVDELRLKFKRP